jgi:hypothetical protein
MIEQLAYRYRAVDVRLLGKPLAYRRIEIDQTLLLEAKQCDRGTRFCIASYS